MGKSKAGKIKGPKGFREDVQKRYEDNGFRPGRDCDPDEIDTHVRPTDVGRSVEAPANAYVDVPKGMVAVPGVVVDHHGVMRCEDTGELAIWHHRCQIAGHGPCERYTDATKFVALDEVVYIAGAPWCPDCVEKMKEDSQRKELQKMFRGSAESN